MQLQTIPQYKEEEQVRALSRVVLCRQDSVTDDGEDNVKDSSNPPSPAAHLPLHLLLADNRLVRYNLAHTQHTSEQSDAHNCTCSDNNSPKDSRKRKMIEEEEEVKNKSRELQKRLVIRGRRIVCTSAGSQENTPLLYLYGNFLHIPQFKWGSVAEVPGGRRRSLAEPDLSTPIDSNTLEATSQQYRPKTPSLYHVEVCPDSQSLEEGGFSQDWFSDVMQLVMKDLNKYGVCVVDDFLGAERAEHILQEVGALHSRGVFHDGQVVSRHVQDQARGMIRGDKITWVTGSEPYCGGIGQLVSVVDSVVAKANKHPNAGKLADYNITWRTRAMVACYPGRDAHYVKHVDNPNGDGRCITAIYYINKDWTPQDGGVLRIYPEGCSDKVAEIEPRFDRMLFFWSDRRNPHEVLPAKITRYAITVWYLDQKEREDYLARVSGASTNT
ncbi:uncharacterized protein LOC121877703 isoform X2 [Homarus americanus]|uniref:uncharacterized protein LOC121877703 isoform X2 n=1 Tax=Homarus americanus TaxID=6706 RepID=UPI001C447F5A|nr:uncharacterized protein LOC121877703 isoform X2 [Homarus americanus]